MNAEPLDIYRWRKFEDETPAKRGIYWVKPRSPEIEMAPFLVEMEAHTDPPGYIEWRPETPEEEANRKATTRLGPPRLLVRATTISYKS